MYGNQPTEQFAYSDGTAQSEYSPFKLESYRLVSMKDDFKRILEIANLTNRVQRDLLMSKAETFYAEVSGVFQQDDVAPADLKRMADTLKRMQDANARMNFMLSGEGIADNVFLNNYLDIFKTNALMFLAQVSKAMTDRNLGLKMKERDTQVERLKGIFSIQNNFKNAFGIPISVEMELFARLCVQRVRNQFDNVFIVEADTGRGKTSFAWAAASTIAQMMGLPFTVTSNFVFNESKSYVDKILRTAPFGVSMVFDEIGNQANSKTHWDVEQVALMNDWRLVRFIGMSIFGCWTSKDELDKQLRTRVNGIITIEERGQAHFRTYNKNRYTPNKEFIPYEIKNKIAYTSQQANMMIEEHDAFNHLDIPFYEIPMELWQPYLTEKNLARTMKRAGAKWLGEAGISAQEYYARFMAELPPDAMRVTKLDMMTYSNKVGYQLSFQQLLKKVSKDCGIRPADLFVSNQNVTDEWDGYFIVNEVIRGYCVRLRERLKGSEESL